MNKLRQILAQEGLLNKQAFTFKEVDIGVYAIGSSNWGISRNPHAPYEYQLLREQMRAGGTWEVHDSARGEDEFVQGPLKGFYDSYFGFDRGQEKLLQDEPAIRAVLRKL